MKIISATTETSGMTKEEIDRFLESKLILQMSTIDEQGEPNIQPVWFYYDKNRTVSEGDKISMKYLGTLDHPIAKMITEHSKKGENVLIEISPKFFSTWDYGKSQQ